MVGHNVSIRIESKDRLARDLWTMETKYKPGFMEVQKNYLDFNYQLKTKTIRNTSDLDFPTWWVRKRN